MAEGGSFIISNQVGAEYQYCYKTNPSNNGWHYYVAEDLNFGRTTDSPLSSGKSFIKLGSYWGAQYGRTPSRLDLSTGIQIRYSDNRVTPVPSINVAYVGLFTETGFMILIGVGFPDGVFLGIGTRF